jgi:hypothetical protein
MNRYWILLTVPPSSPLLSIMHCYVMDYRRWREYT